MKEDRWIEEIKLDPYEQEIEDNLEFAERVEDEELWKERLSRAARNYKRKRELVLIFKSEEDKKRALEILKKFLGDSFVEAKV